MLKNLSLIKKCIQYCAAPNARLLCNAISVAKLENNPLPPIVDIDMDNAMYEDTNGDLVDKSPLEKEQKETEKTSKKEKESEKNTEVKAKTAGDGAVMVPVDINPWVDEEEAKQGTIEIGDPEESGYQLPPIPEHREGKYVFRGIKVILPKKMLQPATYRYRLDVADQATLADDMRVCRFDK